MHATFLESANTAGSGWSMPSASPRGNGGQIQSARAYRPPLKKAALEALRIKIKSASYTGVFGRQLDIVFGRFDKDGSGQLDDDKVRQALRRVLKIPPSMLTDGQILDLCAFLDADNSGTVSISELVDFVGTDSEVSQRTGKKVQSMIISDLIEEQGLPQLSPSQHRSQLAASTQASKESHKHGSNAGVSSNTQGEPVDSTLPPVTPGRPTTAQTAAKQGEQIPANNVWTDLFAQDPSQSPNSPNSARQKPGQVLPNLAG